MLAIALGITMAVLDAAVANVALPTIAGELRTTAASSIWVINAYQLAVVAILLPLASLGERIGYRRVYQVGLVVFTGGSLACALSHTLPQLVASRVAQGFGAAGIMSMNGALVRFTYPQSSLGRGVGLNALVVSVAAAVGPTVASAILSVGSWEWLFAINVPIGIGNLVLASRALPHSDLSGRRFDWPSAALSAGMFALFFVGVDAFSHGGLGGAPVAVVEVAAAMTAAVVLVFRGRAAAAPLIPVDLMRIPVFALSVATSVCSFMAYMLAFVSLPFFFESVLHRDQVATGLLMTPWPVAVGLAAPIAGRLSDRVPASILGSAGLAVLAGGLVLLALMPSHATDLEIVWRTALCGLGFGFFQAPNNRTMLASAPRRRAGAAGGMLATARLTGMTGGAALAALLFRAVPHGAETFDLAAAAGFAALAAVASVTRFRRSPSPAAPERRGGAAVTGETS